MTVFADTYDTATPPGGADPTEADDRMREIKAAVQERMDVDHYWEKTGTEVSDPDTGEHRKVTLRTGSAPAAVADKGFVYAKDVDSKAELFYRDEDGNEVQITTGGIIKLTSAALLAILANDTYFTGVDNAGTGTVNLIKAGDNDLATLPDGAEMASDAAPGEAEGIANRKYVNDQDTAQFASGGSIEGIFGSWTAKDSGGSVNLVKDEVYKVGSDGFVVIYDTDSPSVITILTDGSNPPTTSRQSSGGIDNKPGSCNCPIKKNDYWKVTCAGVIGIIYWLPIGTGTCVKQ